MQVAPFSIHFKPELKDRLDQYHKRSNLTRRLIIEQALERWLDEQEPLLEDQLRRERTR